jgi:hypothetical protein
VGQPPALQRCGTSIAAGRDFSISSEALRTALPYQALPSSAVEENWTLYPHGLPAVRCHCALR